MILHPVAWKCEHTTTEAPHPCPYKDELGRTPEQRAALCRCCDECTKQCAYEL